MAQLNDFGYLDAVTRAFDLNNDLSAPLLTRPRRTRVLDKLTERVSEQVLSFLNASVLVQACRSMPPLPPAALFKALHDTDWSENAIHRVITTQEWRKLPFDDLNTISPCMFNDEAFLKVWLDAMLKNLCDPACAGVMRSVIESCPELDFSSETPESDRGGER